MQLAKAILFTKSNSVGQVYTREMHSLHVSIDTTHPHGYESRPDVYKLML